MDFYSGFLEVTSPSCWDSKNSGSLRNQQTVLSLGLVSVLDGPMHVLVVGWGFLVDSFSQG